MTTEYTNLKPSEVKDLAEIKALVTDIKEKANLDMSKFKNLDNNYFIAFGEKSMATKSLKLSILKEKIVGILLM